MKIKRFEEKNLIKNIPLNKINQIHQCKQK